jgi:hypothetical protein
MSKQRKAWYSKLVNIIERECPPEHYIAVVVENPSCFAIDLSPIEAVRKLRDKGYDAETFIHYRSSLDSHEILINSKH